MTEAMWLIAAVISAVISMGWLALSYQAHWQQVFADKAGHHAPRRLKALGWVGLLLSAVFCLLADHPTMAALVWVMLLAVAAMLVAQILSRRPRLLRLIYPVMLNAKN